MSRHLVICLALSALIPLSFTFPANSSSEIWPLTETLHLLASADTIGKVVEASGSDISNSTDELHNVEGSGAEISEKGKLGAQEKLNSSVEGSGTEKALADKKKRYVPASEEDSDSDEELNKAQDSNEKITKSPLSQNVTDAQPKENENGITLPSEEGKNTTNAAEDKSSSEEKSTETKGTEKPVIEEKKNTTKTVEQQSSSEEDDKVTEETQKPVKAEENTTKATVVESSPEEKSADTKKTEKPHVEEKRHTTKAAEQQSSSEEEDKVIEETQKPVKAEENTTKATEVKSSPEEKSETKETQKPIVEEKKSEGEGRVEIPKTPEQEKKSKSSEENNQISPKTEEKPIDFPSKKTPEEKDNKIVIPFVDENGEREIDPPVNPVDVTAEPDVATTPEQEPKGVLATIKCFFFSWLLSSC